MQIFDGPRIKSLESYLRQGYGSTSAESWVLSQSLFKGDTLPVETVNWNEAKHYCELIGGRLPTEAEWEYAARAGTVGERYGDLDMIAWYKGNGFGQTHPVGTKAPNAWNLYDMLGNVRQWTADSYEDTYYAEGSDRLGQAYGKLRGSRGGSSDDDPRHVRVSDRSRFLPALRSGTVGFRCVGE